MIFRERSGFTEERGDGRSQPVREKSVKLEMLKGVVLGFVHSLKISSMITGLWSLQACSGDRYSIPLKCSL